jgi:hypothetical protein
MLVPLKGSIDEPGSPMGQAGQWQSRSMRLPSYTAKASAAKTTGR